MLTVVREGGGVATQRTSHGEFFALHDLTHLVVESQLGFGDAFFGLLGKGWDFGAFTDKADPRYAALPREALVAEHIVGVISRRALEVARSDPELRDVWCEEVAAEIAASLSGAGLVLPAALGERLVGIASRLEQLMTAWRALPPGEHLELHFPDGPGA